LPQPRRLFAAKTHFQTTQLSATQLSTSMGHGRPRARAVSPSRPRSARVYYFSHVNEPN
jgi:hypothetical protein